MRTGIERPWRFVENATPAGATFHEPRMESPKGEAQPAERDPFISLQPPKWAAFKRSSQSCAHHICVVEEWVARFRGLPEEEGE